MVDAVKHLDWTGLPTIDYECFNMFAVDVNNEGNMTNFRCLDNKSNGIHMEMKKREHLKASSSSDS